MVTTVIAAVAIPMFLMSKIDGSITAKADWLHSRQENIYAKYDAKLHHAQQLALQAKVNAASSIKLQKLDELPKYDVDPTCVQYDADGTCIYTIQHGDTLTHISKMFGYSVDHIANHNQIRDVNLIYANSSLRIPRD